MYVCLSVTFLLIFPSPKVFTSDDPPRPSRPKAGLGLVFTMMTRGSARADAALTAQSLLDGS